MEYKKRYCACGCKKEVTKKIRPSGGPYYLKYADKCTSPTLNKLHGKTKTTEFNVWQGMIGRCYNIKNKKYKNYGGRGISVCERWKSFKNFFEDMGLRPDGTSIDRINNDGNYSKENCRWATTYVQANNKTTNVVITINGEINTLSYFCSKYNVDYMTVYQRIKKLKWDPEYAIFEKKDGRTIRTR